MLKELGYRQRDLLTELGTIGTGNAANAMADLLGKKITINVPRVDLVSFDKVAEFVGGRDKVMASVLFRVKGKLPGAVVVFFEPETIESLVETFLGTSCDLYNLSELEQSAIKEIGNMLAGAYLAALADFSELKMYASIPALAVDMVEAVLSVPMIKLGRKSDHALLIQATFFEAQKNKGCVLFVPDPGGAQKLLTLFGVVDNG